MQEQNIACGILFYLSGNKAGSKNELKWINKTTVCLDDLRTLKTPLLLSHTALSTVLRWTGIDAWLRIYLVNPRVKMPRVWCGLVVQGGGGTRWWAALPVSGTRPERWKYSQERCCFYIANTSRWRWGQYLLDALLYLHQIYTYTCNVMQN